MSEHFDLGHLVEGIVEQDPLDDRLLIRSVDSKGNLVLFDILDALSRLKGKEIRLTLNTIENLERMAHLVSGEQVLGITAEDLGMPHSALRLPRTS